MQKHTIYRQIAHYQQHYGTVGLSIVLAWLSLLLLSSVSVAVNLADPIPACVVGNNDIGGFVFRDYNADGIQNTLEPGFGASGMLVTAYDANDSAVAVTFVQPNGLYNFPGLASGANYRVEFSGLPSYLRYGATGANAGPAAQIVTGATCSINLAVNNPADYCNRTTARLATSCFTPGDNTTATARPALTEHSYLGNSASITKTAWATSTQIGTIFGLAYQRSSGVLFGSSYVRRGAGQGPENSTGAIYRMKLGSTPALFIDLNATGVISTGVNPHPNGSANFTVDSQAYTATGKVGIGDLEISEDEQTLYAVNLFRKELVIMPLGSVITTPVAPTAGQIITRAVPIPNDCNGNGITEPSTSDIRPFALKYQDGLLYLGLVCSGQSMLTSMSPVPISRTQLSAIMPFFRAYVYTFNPATNTFDSSPILDISLDYPRRHHNGNLNDPTNDGEWLPWSDVWLPPHDSPPHTGNRANSQPVFTDIEFDGLGFMMLGLRDRFGDQAYSSGDVGPANITPGVGTRHGGDILLACQVGGVWQLENAGACNGRTTGDPDTNTAVNNNSGPGNHEFYYAEHYDLSYVPDYHRETTIGSLAQIRGSGEIASTVYDSFDIFENGTVIFDNSNGSRLRAVQVFAPNTGFQKAAGLGDLELLCDLAPIELGDRVWYDIDGDGIQAPDEAGIAGVAVKLYSSTGTLLGTATTDSTGRYVFGGLSSSNLITGSLQPYTSYYLSINQPSQYLSATNTLTVTGVAYGDITIPNTGSSSSTLPDLSDSDALIGAGVGMPWSGYPVIGVTTGGGGSNEHSLDFGFVATGSRIGNYVWQDLNNNGLQDVGEPGLAGVVVELWDSTHSTRLYTTTTNADGLYLFSGLSAGTYQVEVTTTAFQNFTQSGDPNEAGRCITCDNRTTVILAANVTYLLADFGYFDPPLNKAVTPTIANPGDTLTYTLSLDDFPGPGLLVNAVVTDAVPTGTNLMTPSITGGGLYSSGVITWSLGSNVAGLPVTANGNVVTGVITITTDTDTYIDENAVTSNFGNNGAITLRTRSGRRNFGLVNFNLSTLPAGASISAAQLNVDVSSTNGSVTVSVNRMLSAWTESGATWSNTGNPPTAGTNYTTTGSTTFSAATTGLKGTNMTSIVQAWAGGATNNGILLIPSGGTDLTAALSSSDSGGQAPRLVITYTAPGPILGSTMTASPLLVQGTGKIITVTLNLTATAGVTNIIPSTPVISVTNGTTALLLSGPTPASATVAANGMVTFTWAYSVSAGTIPGSVRFAARASGTGAGLSSQTFPTATSNSTLVIPPLSYRVTVTNPATANPVTNIASFADSNLFSATLRSNEASTLIIIPSHADLSLSKSVNITAPVIGDAITYTVVISNAGPYSTTNVTVRDLLPSGLSFHSALASQGIYSNVTGLWSAGVVTQNQTLTLTLVATVTSAATITNSAEITTSTTLDPDSTPGNGLATEDDQASVMITSTIRRADLTVVKYESDDPIIAGTSLTYTFVITNNGPQSADNVTISDTLPAGTLFQSATAGCSHSAGLVSCTNGFIGANQVQTVSVTVLVSPTFFTVGNPLGLTTLTNTVNVSSSTVDPDLLNNRATQTTTVTSVADLSISKSDSLTSVVPGNSVTYLIYVTNTGPSAVAGAIVSDTFPALLSNTTWICGASADSSCGAPSGSNSISTTVNLALNSQVTFTVSATVLSTASGSLINSAETTPPPGTTDPITNNNQSSDSDLLLTGTLTGTVYVDANYNGVQDVGEGNSSITVVITTSVGTTITLTTDVNGSFAVIVPVGATSVDVDVSALPVGVLQTLGSDPTTVTVPSGGVAMDINGFQLFGQLTGHIFWDMDGLGSDNSDPDLANISVVITNSLGMTQTVTTDAQGNYTATVPIGGATVDVVESTLPAGSVQTAGSDTTPVTVDPGATTDAGIDGYQQQGLVQGTIYLDEDGDGIYTLGIDTPLTVTVLITDSNGVTYTILTANGYFSRVVPIYTTTVDVVDSGLPANLILTSGSSDPTTLQVPGGGVATDDTGYLKLGRIGDTVWWDLDSDGIQDDIEPGLSGIVISLTLPNSTVLTTTTGISGYYNFTDLTPGVYTVTVNTATLPAPMNQSVDPDAILDSRTVVTLTSSNSQIVTADFGYVGTSSIGDRVWHDLNRDGDVDAGEPGLAGIVISLTLPGGTIITTTTNLSGSYDFIGLAAGDYTVNIDENTLPLGAVLTTANEPLAITLTTGQDYNDADFGYQRQGVVDGILYHDVNIDGTYQAGIDTLLVSVTVLITDSNGMTYPVTSNASGYFSQTVLYGTTSVAIDDATLPAGLMLEYGFSDPISVNVPANGLVSTAFAYVEPLTIDKDTLTPGVVAGTQVTYTIALRNNAASPITGVTASDTLPTGFTYAASSVIGSGIIRAPVVNPSSGDSIPTWGAWTINGGGVLTITFSANVTSSAALGVYENTASATSNQSGLVNDEGSTSQDSNTQPGTDPADDEDVTVTALVNLSIHKSDAPDPVVAGGLLTYTIVVTNAGPSVANNVVITDALISTVQFISASAGCSELAAVVTCNLGTIPVNSTATITIVVLVDSDLLVFTQKSVIALPLDRERRRVAVG